MENHAEKSMENEVERKGCLWLYKDFYIPCSWYEDAPLKGMYRGYIVEWTMETAILLNFEGLILTWNWE